MANHTEKSLKDLLTTYKLETDKSAGTKDNIELEVRFKDIDREVFEAMYNSMKSNPNFTNPQLTTTINIISENVYERNQLSGNKNSYIRTIEFVNGKSSSDTYHTKSRLFRSVMVDDYVKYTVGLSKESPSNSFNANANAQVRFKIRVSFDYVTQEVNGIKWRFDLTAIKQGTINDIGQNFKSIKDNLFTAQLTVDNLLSTLNFSLVNRYEIEIEHISGIVTRDDLNIVKVMFGIINPQYINEMAYQDEICEIAEQIDPHRLELFKRRGGNLKQLANQAIAMTKNNYYEKIYPANGYLATIKADGERCFVVINGNRLRIVSTELETFSPDVIELGKLTIADCELLKKPLASDNKSDQSVNLTIRIFDVLSILGQGVYNQGMEERIKYIPEVMAIINKCIDHITFPVGQVYKINVVSAIYTVLDQNNLEIGYRNVYDDADHKYDFPFDGIMVSEPGHNYRDTPNYKWKPYEYQTIDFLAVKCPQSLLGIKPYVIKDNHELYLLFVGIDHTMREQLGLWLIPNYKQIFDDVGSYYPIQFSPSTNPYAYLYYRQSEDDIPIDRKIIELSRNRSNTEWIFHRVRNDRKISQNYYGNDFRIAELTYSNYIDPFEFNELWEKNAGYFDKTLLGTHFAPNKFKRFVISMILKDNLSDSKWIIDEAAGRGADLHRYQEIGTEHTLFIDIDSAAIAELISRKFSYLSTKKRGVKSFVTGKSGDTTGKMVVKAYDRVSGQEYDKLITKHLKAMTIHTLVADLKEPVADLMARTYQFGLNPGIVNGIICNFALHYMCDRIENLRNLLMFNAKMLKPGGLFMFTVMDGEKIFELLEDYEQGHSWELRENSVLKYAIRKDYKGTKFAATGQMISVLLPFSTEMRSEPLCNIDVVISEAKKLGFSVELNSSMSTQLQKFEKLDRNLYSQLTADDKEYISLFKYVTLRFQ